MVHNVSRVIDLVCFAAEYRGVEDITIPPAGCLYVGGALKMADYEVRIHHIFSRQIEETVAKILAHPPLLVGFSIITGSPVAHSARMSRLIKQSAPEIPVVWGGIHPSLMPEACLQEDFVDFVIRGEGEVTATELADLLYGSGRLEDIAGLCWKDANGTIHNNPDRPFISKLDQVRQDWSLVDPMRYVRTAFDGTKYIALITSRGCPHNCGFCYNLVFNKRRWRAHSVDYVVDLVQELRHVTGIDWVVFNDDNFLVNESRAFQILERLSGIGVRVAWIEVRLDRIDEEILRQLAKYGVRTLFVGWESGSDRTLKEIDKGFNTSLILESFRLIANYSFEVDASAIVGFPFESEADWEATIDMALRIDAINPGKNKFNIGVYVPYPGTPIMEQALQRGFKFPDDIESWDSFDILKGDMRLPWMSAAQVQRVARIDRYAKMLFTGGGGKRIVNLIRGLFAVLARFRLKSRLLFFPIETFLYDRAVAFYLRYRIASIKVGEEGGKTSARI